MTTGEVLGGLSISKSHSGNTVTFSPQSLNQSYNTWVTGVTPQDFGGSVAQTRRYADDAALFSIKKEEKGMRSIFKTYIVDPKKEKVLATVETIAENAQEAERKALMSRAVSALDISDISNVDIVSIPATTHFIRAKKDVQKVKVVKGDDD